MLQGVRAALHEGTVVYVNGLAPTPVRATIAAHDAASGKWRVRLQGSQWQGQELLVPEDSIRVSFCLLPSSLSNLQEFVRVTEETEQGACGRGLIVLEPVLAGRPIFAEPPLIVVGGLIMPHRTHHSERFLAYSALKRYTTAELQRAQAGHATDLQYSQTLAAFHDLGMASHVPAHLAEGAQNIAVKMFGDASRAGEVSDVLRRFHSNQFRLDNGADPDDKDFASSAVYAFMSRGNHSCWPSVSVVPARVYASQNGTETCTEQSGGILLAYAQRDLAPGDRLTYNYGPAELVTSWGLAKRREYLLAELGFECGCERCVAEEAGEAWPPSGRPTSASPSSLGRAAANARMAAEAEEALHLEEWQIDEIAKHMAAKARAERMAEVEGEAEEVGAEVDDAAAPVEEVDQVDAVGKVEMAATVTAKVTTRPVNMSQQPTEIDAQPPEADAEIDCSAAKIDAQPPEAEQPPAAQHQTSMGGQVVSPQQPADRGPHAFVSVAAVAALTTLAVAVAVAASVWRPRRLPS